MERPKTASQNARRATIVLPLDSGVGRHQAETAASADEPDPHSSTVHRNGATPARQIPNPQGQLIIRYMGVSDGGHRIRVPCQCLGRCRILGRNKEASPRAAWGLTWAA